VPRPVVAVATEPNDQCPNEPEDKDGFQDEDGCPDPDNDQDHLLDADDQCPNEPETYNNHKDDDGCPDRDCVIVKQFPLCISELILFERGKDTPTMAQDGAIIDNTAEAMKQTVDDIQVVELRGFRGTDEPRKLSKQRATAVAQLLIARGVDPGRLTIVDGGAGAPNELPNGWHRLELSIAQQRRTIEDADEIICTPMGRYFRRLTDDERAARCR
jgi:outer membrane protein OmpA-like peptidoglycan-associated protein